MHAYSKVLFSIGGYLPPNDRNGVTPAPRLRSERYAWRYCYASEPGMANETALLTPAMPLNRTTPAFFAPGSLVSTVA